MQRVLIWDVPVRVIHGVITLGLGTAFVLAQVSGERDALFPYHALAGLLVVVVVLIRLVWGIVGSRHARLATLPLAPMRLANYARSLFRRTAPQYAAHNPATAWVMVAMFAVFIAVIATGLLAADGNDAAEELHGPAVYTLLGLVGVHVAGVLIHSLRHREVLPLAMVDGRKLADPGVALASPRLLAGLVILMATTVAAVILVRSYDSTRRAVRIPGTARFMQLGEPPDTAEPSPGRDRSTHHDD